MVFKRKLDDKMLEWKQKWSGEYALLIKGARRVGKSTLAEQFAKNEYKSYVFIDFSRVSKTLLSLFDDISDLDFLFMRLQQETGVKLYEQQSVIVFDEVQECPRARQAIKHLVKDGRYDYIETGSLISIRKNVQNIIIPSEEMQMILHPLDLEEFMWATGHEVGLSILRMFYDKRVPLDATHRTMMRNLRLYMLVGGMPQAVNAYLKYNNMQMVDKVKREIIELYDNDFMKMDPSGRASMIFKNIPAQLNSNASRFMISSAIDARKTDAVDIVISEMRESMVVNLAYHSTNPNVGLGLHKNLDA